MSRKVVFKTYHQNQLSLLPPSYDDLVPKNHPVRIVNAIVDHLDISSLEKTYKGGGASSYHPRMLQGCDLLLPSEYLFIKKDRTGKRLF